MAIKVHSKLFSSGARNFEAWDWVIDDDGYLELCRKDKSRIVTFPPGNWNMVEDLDPEPENRNG